MKNLHQTRQPRSQDGFTLIELMVTLVVAVVVAGVAVPNMRTFLLNNRLTGTANEMLRTIQTGRTEAIKRQKNVVVCMSANPSAATPTCGTSSLTGWIVFQDDNANWDHDSGEEIIETHSFESNNLFVLSNNSKKFSYAATGFENPAGTTASTQTPSTAIVICDKRGTVVVAGQSVARGIAVSNTGRPTASKSKAVIDNLLDTSDGDGIGTTCPP
jgi:type IV fimbrial biogenesis protein FimT